MSFSTETFYLGKPCRGCERKINFNATLIDIFSHKFKIYLFKGRPRPNVTWYLENTVIDESFETRKDGITVNHLSYPNIGRQHLNARLVCVASNTNLTPPNNKAVILDVNCKWKVVHCCFYPRGWNDFFSHTIPSQRHTANFFSSNSMINGCSTPFVLR